MIVVYRILEVGGLSSFEAACMVNLLPESAEEAKNLIPSLDVSLPSIILPLSRQVAVLSLILILILILMAAALVIGESFGVRCVSCAYADTCGRMRCVLPNNVRATLCACAGLCCSGDKPFNVCQCRWM